MVPSALQPLIYHFYMKLHSLYPAIAIFAGISSAHAVFTTINLTGAAGNPTSFGNTLSFSQNGLSVTASAWAYTGSSGTLFENAGLGQYSTGLGVSDRGEGLGAGDPSHQVDNIGPDNFVMFSFGNNAVDISSINIDPYGIYDRDVSYWVGNVAPGTDLTGKSYAQLAALGFTQGRFDALSTPSETALDVAIGKTGNTILFGTYVGEPAGTGAGTTTDEDRFKIASITAGPVVVPPPPVPEPTTALFGLALTGFCTASRRRGKATA